MAKSKVEQIQSKDCFVIMPISDCDGYDVGHFDKVYEDLFKVAIKGAGYNPIRADEVKQTNLIHLDILQKLLESPIAVCDLSTRNPNVLFELGLRQAFDKPTVLVQEIGTPKIFDISPLRYTEYKKGLKYRDVLSSQKAIEEAITSTIQASEKGEGINSIISIMSLSSPASLKEVSGDDTGKVVQLLLAEMQSLKSEFRNLEINSRGNSEFFITTNNSVDNTSSLMSLFEKVVKLDSEIENINSETSNRRHYHLKRKANQIKDELRLILKTGNDTYSDEAQVLMGHIKMIEERLLNAKNKYNK